MSQDFSDEFELTEDVVALDEDEEITSISETLYIALSKQPKLIERIPLAFTVPDELEPVVVEGCTLAWTKVALATLAEIQKGTPGNGRSNVKNLPYASLRGFLEVELTNAARIQSNLGLSKYALNTQADQAEPFAYITDDSEAEIKNSLRPLLNDWITNFLKPFVEREKVSPELLEQLEDLQQQGELLTISPFKSHTLPWAWSEETGTALPKDKHAYRMLADYVARQIAGQEIFQGIGSMKRIISSSRTFTSGVAELITDPYTLPNKKGRFSLVLRVEVVTYPSLHQPLLKIDISKRRWLSQLKSPGFDRSAIRGFVFPQDCCDRAFSYWVDCKEEKDKKQESNNKQGKNKTWRWVTDTGFEILKRKFGLPLSSSDGQQIALGKVSTDCCQVMLTYRNGLQDNPDDDEDSAEEYGIEAGVPETDKLEAFEKITEILKPFGLHPFEAYVPVKSSDSSDGTASRMINLPTLLSAVQEVLETKSILEVTPQYLARLEDIQLDGLLRKHFGFGLGEIEWGRKSLQFSKRKSPNQTEELQSLVQANQAAMRRLYPNEQLSLIIFYEDELQTEAKLLQGIIQVLWGGAFEVLVNRLPADTHGLRDKLPGEKLKAKERSAQRIEAWRHTAQQMEARKQRTFCLIVARKFFPDPSGQKKAKRDDRVNKPSTRQALASIAGACSQLLEPIAKTRTNRFKLGDFFHRVQSALKDLLSAHSGRIDDLQEKVDKYLEDIPHERRPKEIIGITVVRKQKGRSRGFIGTTFLPIAIRLQVNTGKSEMCCAYEKGNTLEISPWNSFPDTLAFISRISPIKLAAKREVAQTRFMEFVKQIISNSVEEGAQPLVLIDSSNCVQLWPWLADVRMNVNQINLGQQYQWMEKVWQGARLIRIRQDLAPGIIEKKVRQFVETSLEDTRSEKELKKLAPDLEIPSASSALKLFRLTATNETGCVAYLSVGRKTLHQYSRGQSCYRQTQINIPLKIAEDSQENTALLCFWYKWYRQIQDSQFVEVGKLNMWFKNFAYYLIYGRFDNIRNKAGLEIHQIGTRPAFSDYWPTPNPLEIVVTLRQPDDDPDQLAALVESLRYSFGHYSEWTALPAPLFFERVVRDYISEFALDDDNTEAEPDL